MAYDAYRDPYARRVRAHQQRLTFEQIKRTTSFHSWKNRQMKVQKEKCAWCHIPLTSDNIRTHVDHVTPLFYEGANDFSNLVLSCSRCNLKKWVNNSYVVPDWVKENDLAMRAKQRLDALRRTQYAQAVALNDELIFDEIRARL